MQLKTLSKIDPEFESYLSGTFSKDHRAIPLQSLNVDTEGEQVTFRIVPISEIETPSFLQKWAEVFKVRSFLLMGLPLLLILTKNSYFDEIEMDPVLVICTVLGCFSLLVGGNLLNDYFDHMRGFDRVHPDQQKKPIQEGWVTAEATRKWSGFYLAVGVFLGIPAVFVNPELLLFCLVPASVGLWVWLSAVRGARYRRGSEFLVFLMAGPLLTVGFQMALTGLFELESLWIGVLTGQISVFLMHLKNFRFIVVNGLSGFQNSIQRFGFEGSKKFLFFWWLAFVLNFVAYHWVYWKSYLVFVVASAVLPLVFSRSFFVLLFQMKSPVGSEMKKIFQVGKSLVSMVMAWWLLETFWLIWDLGLGANW